MDFAQGLSSLLGIGLASGLNIYAVVLTVGLAQRLGWLQSLPEGLAVFANTWVLAAAGVMYLAEFVADKVPGFTPFWDGIHTFIRPVGAALVAFGAFGNLDPVMRTIAMLVAGSLALSSHATKMGTRLAAHSVPDPVTHSAISIAEDFSVVGILLLAYSYPWIALPLLLAMVVGIAMALPFLFRVLGFLLRTLQGRLLSFVSPDAASEIPAWARESGSTMVLGFIRSGKGLGRLRRAYWKLRPGEGSLRVKGWLGSKAMELKPPGQHVEGLFLDYVELPTKDGNLISIYLTKDWAARYREAM
jgi:hypothetical protein